MSCRRASFTSLHLEAHPQPIENSKDPISSKNALIDEAQHLEDKALDELRCIHDDTGVPIVFACNESLRARTRPGAPAAFAQFVTRIGPRCHVRATPENIEALAHRYGIAGPNAVAWLRKTGAGLGGGRVAARLLDMCKDRGEINLAALERASLALGGGA